MPRQTKMTPQSLSELTTMPRNKMPRKTKMTPQSRSELTTMPMNMMPRKTKMGGKGHDFSRCSSSKPFGSFPTHHDARDADDNTSTGDCSSTMCLTSTANNQSVFLLTASEVDSTGGGASPGVSGDRFGDFSPSWFATEDTPASPVEGARRAIVNPTVFTMPPSLGQPVSDVDNALEAPRVDDKDVDVDAAPNAFDAETLETTARETPHVAASVAASVFPITPSASSADFVAYSAGEPIAAYVTRTPPPVPFAQIAAAARLGRRDHTRGRCGFSVEPNNALFNVTNAPAADDEWRLDDTESRPPRLSHGTKEGMLHGTGSALRALIEQIARPGHRL